MTPELRAALMRQPIVMVPGRTTTLTSEAMDAIAPIIDAALDEARDGADWGSFDFAIGAECEVRVTAALLAAADDLKNPVLAYMGRLAIADWLRARANEGTDVPKP